jgi:hypothetical protein
VDRSGIHPDTVPTSVPCPTCGESVDATARLVLWPDRAQVAHILVDLDPARAHAATHPGAMPAVLAHFGIPW